MFQFYLGSKTNRHALLEFLKATEKWEPMKKIPLDFFKEVKGNASINNIFSIFFLLDVTKPNVDALALAHSFPQLVIMRRSPTPDSPFMELMIEEKEASGKKMCYFVF